jgi:hypothetical protein
MPKLTLGASGIARRRTEKERAEASFLCERRRRRIRDARAAPKLDVENAIVSILQCALNAASLDVNEVVW